MHTPQQASLSVAQRLIALLAREGEPMELTDLPSLLDIPPHQLAEVLRHAQELVAHAGLLLSISEQTVVLAAPSQPKAEELTPAARETLAAICYLAPVSKEALDHIRGVNCAAILTLLLKAGLIERREENGTVSYEPSALTLARLGVQRVEELPDYVAYRRTLRAALGYSEEVSEGSAG